MGSRGRWVAALPSQPNALLPLRPSPKPQGSVGLSACLSPPGPLAGGGRSYSFCRSTACPLPCTPLQLTSRPGFRPVCLAHSRAGRRWLALWLLRVRPHLRAWRVPPSHTPVGHGGLRGGRSAWALVSAVTDQAPAVGRWPVAVEPPAPPTSPTVDPGQWASAFATIAPFVNGPVAQFFWAFAQREIRQEKAGERTQDGVQEPDPLSHPLG